MQLGLRHTGRMPEVLSERVGAVLRLTLNRPDRLNAVSEELYQRLLDLLADADADPEVRAVLLTGAGRAFCVGADLKAHRSGQRTSEQRAHYVELAWRVCERIQTIGTPLIAAVHGYA